MARARLLGPCLVLIAGCTTYPDEGRVVKQGPGVVSVPGHGSSVQAARARPIMGGTLTVTADGSTAIASDADRNAIFVVDLKSQRVTTLPVEAEDVPGRVSEDDAGNAYVVLRGSGQIAKVELGTPRISARLDVCDAPRGIAFEARTQRLHVACQGGELLSLDVASGALVRQIRVMDDLRDVVVSGDRLVVTSFRKAEISVVDSTGQVTQRLTPNDTLGGAASSVAWRTVAADSGVVYVMHQVADTNGGVSIEPSGYGGGAGPCSSSIVAPVLTSISFDENGQANLHTRRRVLGGAGPTDIAVTDSGTLALVVTGNAWTEAQPAVVDGHVDLDPGCELPNTGTPGIEPVAVAFDADGRRIVQSREPAVLSLQDGSVIPLSDESHSSTGLALFHMNTGSGIACASCHPEGMDDAQTWLFSEIGPRRTQTVAGGIKARAPFHWDGDMQDFETLVNEVMVGRMSLAVRPNPLQMNAFVEWVDGIERPQPRVGDTAAIERGEVLFFDSAVGCDECHTGPALTNNRIADVGTGGDFVVPTLTGIARRAPYIHDGCAETLKDRFSPCGGGDAHGKTSHLSSEQLDDLVAYLETL